MPCKQASLSIGAPLGKLEGIHLPGTFWVERIVYLGSFLGHGGRGSVSSTRGLGPTMTARGQSIGISIGMLPQTLIM